MWWMLLRGRIASYAIGGFESIKEMAKLRKELESKICWRVVNSI